MFQPDIDVIRAVHSDRIRRDVFAQFHPALAPRESAVAAGRRAIGRSIVRLGVRIAADPATERHLRLAR
jgi:hypothetical protein